MVRRCLQPDWRRRSKCWVMVVRLHTGSADTRLALAAAGGDGEAVQEADTGTLSSGGFLLEPKLVTPVTHRVIFTYARHSLNH